MNDETARAISHLGHKAVVAMHQLTAGQLDLLIAVCEAKSKGETYFLEAIKDANGEDCKAVSRIMRLVAEHKQEATV